FVRVRGFYLRKCRLIDFRVLDSLDNRNCSDGFLDFVRILVVKGLICRVCKEQFPTYLSLIDRKCLQNRLHSSRLQLHLCSIGVFEDFLVKPLLEVLVTHSSNLRIDPCSSSILTSRFHRSNLTHKAIHTLLKSCNRVCRLLNCGKFFPSLLQ